MLFITWHYARLNIFIFMYIFPIITNISVLHWGYSLNSFEFPEKIVKIYIADLLNNISQLNVGILQQLLGFIHSHAVNVGHQRISGMIFEVTGQVGLRYRK